MKAQKKRVEYHIIHCKKCAYTFAGKVKPDVKKSLVKKGACMTMILACPYCEPDWLNPEVSGVDWTICKDLKQIVLSEAVL